VRILPPRREGRRERRSPACRSSAITGPEDRDARS
jgi:hypothetical protein